jgi:hypothetical protein
MDQSPQSELVGERQGQLVFQAEDLAWQLACLGEAAKDLGVDPPSVAVTGPAELLRWSEGHLGSVHS